MQWANYQENSVKDLLNYRFGMVKAGLDFRFPHGVEPELWSGI